MILRVYAKIFSILTGTSVDVSSRATSPLAPVGFGTIAELSMQVRDSSGRALLPVQGGSMIASDVELGWKAPALLLAPMWMLVSPPLLPLLLLRPASGATRTSPTSRRALVVGGGLAGVAITAGGLLQQVGIDSTTASNAGFITSLYVVLVPILGLTVGYRILPRTWLGIILATVGLYLLSIYDLSRVRMGDLLVFLGTIAWAVQVLLIGWATMRADPIRLTIIQSLVATGLCLIAALIMEGFPLEAIWETRWYLLYSGIMATSVAFTFQIIGQRSAPPAHAAMLLGLEAVFAAIAGYLLLDDRLGGVQLVGCGLMLLAVLSCQTGRGTRTPFLPEGSRR